MSDRYRYTQALEKRMEWQKWSGPQRLDGGEFMYVVAPQRMRKRGLEGPWHAFTEDCFRRYRHSLNHGPTYIMNSRFCELTDLARRSIPDHLKYDPAWLLSKSGWMWLETPFEVPKLEQPVKDRAPEAGWELSDDEGKPLTEEPLWRVAAVSWLPLPGNTALNITHMDGRTRRIVGSGEGSTYFMFWLDRRMYGLAMGGYGMWSQAVLVPGDGLLERIHEFENLARNGSEGGYVEDRTTDMLHEFRWLYAALHLMSEKLATTRQQPAERHTRRRMQKEDSKLEPLVRVVTLRRMEEAREVEGQHHNVDWKWQWQVHGHWRNQFHPSTGEHQPKWIDEYVKGPPDKPFKPPQHTIYVASR